MLSDNLVDHEQDTASVLLQCLMSAPTPEDKQVLDALACEVQEKTARLSSMPISNETARRLTMARVECSGTLRREHTLFGPSREAVLTGRKAWSNANQLVLSWVADGIALSMDNLCLLNATLLGSKEPSLLRKRNIFLGADACVPATEIGRLISPMLEAVQHRTSTDGPLFGAGLLYQWIVSVHPFEDGNGRTARLAVDALLSQHGLVPVSFAEMFDAFVAIHPGRHETNMRRLRHAAEAVAQGVLNTLDVLAGNA